MVELVLVKAEDVRPLRRQVLRPGKAAKSSEYEGDDDSRTMHAVFKDEKTIVGAVSLFHDPRGDVESEVWRVRGMAVLPERQGEGIGGRLLGAVKAVAEKRGGGVWANVRMTALPFYSAQGFKVDSNEFKIPGLGEHVVMIWRPKP
ncbi:MAG: putative N-acetyltransferase YhbS [Pseudohongiellaceae bacterium]|jgi:predicted N-acetyltransferase YhbS